MPQDERRRRGRPDMLESEKKRKISIRLDPGLLVWMDNQPGTNRARLIEDALRRVHQITG